MIEMLNCDCMEYMKELRDDAYDVAICDPPYGIGVTGNNIIPKFVLSHKYKYDKKWDIRPPDEYFTELKRVSKEQIIWGGNYFLDNLGYCKAPIIWDKLNGDSMYADGEFAWTSRGLRKNLKIFRHKWCGFYKDSERGTEKIHPTQKPVILYKWILQNYVKRGMKILDTHGGSGSICIACHDLDYDLTWLEIDVDFYNAALLRYNNHIAQKLLFNGEESSIQYKQQDFLYDE